MSGMRDHRLYGVTIKGVREYYPRDGNGDVAGKIIREEFTATKHIIAPTAAVAEAHVRYWNQFAGIVGTPEITVDKGMKINAFLEEHIW
jgi:hypothetical protein